jgi:hypothetical protein
MPIHRSNIHSLNKKCVVLIVRRILKLTLSLFSPNLDQNVTFDNVLCPVSSLNTRQLLYGGLYRCRLTAGLTLLRFSTLWRPIESANSIQDRSLKLGNLGALRSIFLGLQLPVKVFTSAINTKREFLNCTGNLGSYQQNACDQTACCCNCLTVTCFTSRCIINMITKKLLSYTI